MIRKSFEVDYIDESDCETLLDALGKCNLLRPHPTSPDPGRQANAMTDGLKDMHREAIIARIAANDRVERGRAVRIQSNRHQYRVV